MFTFVLINKNLILKINIQSDQVQLFIILNYHLVHGATVDHLV